ncbi:hypothetical protein GUITHDRAFT_143063 [Guillardia theta CCMP2712]|uniref:Uncharacterized protein n=1 Tax=Guillardia theta (strain CCMP2712) TaxID=905079 RepID=L1IW54_GUITC|nr:hypothetical protein GUITHDRAFT_143063 [Guillardia theta CCMP2712]EKX40124.1 hypothetical protein GUITHDRAFT_143063 [Guillardia theta CCMP2712]|eukprot:XP_005827104.1 hypothetical protein GUITHDRAFT_143063 [Guillardia theta CCMP2712]
MSPYKFLILAFALVGTMQPSAAKNETLSDRLVIDLMADYGTTFLTVPGALNPGAWVCYNMTLDVPTLRKIVFYEKPKIFARLEPCSGYPRLSASVYGCPSLGYRKVWEYYSEAMKVQLQSTGQMLQADWEWQGDVQSLAIDATHRNYFFEVNNPLGSGFSAFKISFHNFDAEIMTQQDLYPIKNMKNWDKNVVRVQPSLAAGLISGGQVLDANTARQVPMNVTVQWYPPGLNGTKQNVTSTPTDGTTVLSTATTTTQTATASNLSNTSTQPAETAAKPPSSSSDYWLVNYENRTMSVLDVAKLYEYAVFIVEITDRVGRDPNSVDPGSCCASPPAIQNAINPSCPILVRDIDGYAQSGPCRSNQYDYTSCAYDSCSDGNGGNLRKKVSKGNCVSCPDSYPDCPREFTTFCDSLTYNVSKLKTAMNQTNVTWDAHVKNASYYTIWTQCGLEMQAGKVNENGEYTAETARKRRIAKNLKVPREFAPLKITPESTVFNLVSLDEWALYLASQIKISTNSSTYLGDRDMIWIAVEDIIVDSNGTTRPALTVLSSGAIQFGINGLNQSNNNVYAINVISRRKATGEAAVHKFMTMQLKSPRYEFPKIDKQNRMLFFIVGASIVGGVLFFVLAAVIVHKLRKNKIEKEKERIAANSKSLTTEMVLSKKEV